MREISHALPDTDAEASLRQTHVSAQPLWNVTGLTGCGVWLGRDFSIGLDITPRARKGENIKILAKLTGEQ